MRKGGHIVRGWILQLKGYFMIERKINFEHLRLRVNAAESMSSSGDEKTAERILAEMAKEIYEGLKR